MTPCVCHEKMQSSVHERTWAGVAARGPVQSVQAQLQAAAITGVEGPVGGQRGVGGVGQVSITLGQDQVGSDGQGHKAGVTGQAEEAEVEEPRQPGIPPQRPAPVSACTAGGVSGGLDQGAWIAEVDCRRSVGGGLAAVCGSAPARIWPARALMRVGCPDPPGIGFLQSSLAAKG